MSRLIRINPRDNVAVALEPLKSGESALGVTLREDIPAGHKFALCDIAENENIVKYGFPIGHATQPIPAGSWVHTHNVKTNLSGLLEYSYHPHPCAMPVDRKATFEGYVREDGRVGIRNEVWIVNTVGCVNGTAKTLGAHGAGSLRRPRGRHSLFCPSVWMQPAGRRSQEHPEAARLDGSPSERGRGARAEPRLRKQQRQ